MDQNLILPRVIARRAQEMPARVYLEDVAGPALTYAGTHEMALRWACAFQRLGVRRDQTVLSMLPTGFDAVGVWLGLGWLRAIEVPVNTAYQGRMLRYVIENSRAEVLVIAERYLPRLAEVADGLSLQTLVVPDADRTPAAVPFRALGRDGFFAGADRADAPGEATLEGPDYWDIATILYTSGTTGPSKGVLVPWAQIYATTTGSMVVADLGPEDAYYCPFPLFHISGKGPLSVMALVGGRVVLRERFDTASFWSDIARHRCTTTLLLGAMANFIYRQEPRADDADTPLRNIVMVPLIPEVEDFKKRFGVRVCTVFNMTEISCPITSDGWNLANEKSCGRVRPGYEARIVDEHDRTVGPGELGELVVRAAEPWQLMVGYWGMPEKTVEAWRNQWLHTGDGFTRDADGNFYFVDRRKDAIRRRGENISSMEVESEVNLHPDVLETAAIAVPSEWGEDEVKVVVVLKPGRRLAPAALLAFLEPRMPKFMLPRYVEFVEALPKTPTEKVRKAELRERGINELTWDRLRSEPRGETSR